MKIGFVLPGFSSNDRDWCIPALLNLVRLAAKDYEVHVFALEYPYRRDVYTVHGATVHSMNGRNRGKWYAPRLWSDTLSAVREEHRCAPFDILHGFWANKPSLIALIAGRALSVPVVVSVAGGELVGLRSISYGGQLTFFERTIVRWTVRGANRLTVGSRYLREIAERWRTDTILLPLGVDSNMFSPGQEVKAHGSIRILNVGSLIPVKGQLPLLDAVAQLERRDLCLEIVGSGRLEQELYQKARRLRITNHVEISKPVAHDALVGKYRSADLIVQASQHEAQGMAVLEAASCGVPVAGTPVGVAPELAEAGGAVVTGGSNGCDLANIMVSALQAREELGHRAREIVERDYSLEATWHKWMDLYQQVRRK